MMTRRVANLANGERCVERVQINRKPISSARDQDFYEQRQQRQQQQQQCHQITWCGEETGNQKSITL